MMANIAGLPDEMPLKQFEVVHCQRLGVVPVYCLAVIAPVQQERRRVGFRYDAPIVAKREQFIKWQWRPLDSQCLADLLETF